MPNKLDFTLDQNRLGMYLSLSIWCVSLVFCIYYFMLEVEAKKLFLLGLISVVGIFASRLFNKKRNLEAVVLQCLLMFVALCFVLAMPVVGKYPIMCALIIALNPVILLTELNSLVVFLNLVACLILLSLNVLLQRTDVGALEQLLDFFIKFMVVIFVFVQVYGLRLILEKKHSNHRNL